MWIIDDDGVGLKEKPEDTRYSYIKRLHRNEAQSQCGVKLNIIDLIPNCVLSLATA